MKNLSRTHLKDSYLLNFCWNRYSNEALYSYRIYTLYLLSYSMKRRFILLLLLLIWLMSLMSFFSILNFLDPYENELIALGLLIISFLWALLWIGSVLLYFIKKVYYRGEIDASHIFASMRQSLLVGILCISYVTLVFFSIPAFIPLLWVMLFLLSLELFLQSLYYSF